MTHSTTQANRTGIPYRRVKLIEGWYDARNLIQTARAGASHPRSLNLPPRSRGEVNGYAAGMREAKKGFRCLKADKQLPALRAALLALQAARSATPANGTSLDATSKAA